MKKFGITLIAAAVMAVSFASSASALAPFKKAFSEKYTDKENGEDFYKVVRKTGCNVCHVKGEDKNVHNAYGKVLEGLIEGNANERLKAAKEAGNKDEVQAAILKELDAAFQKAAEAENEDGVKFGELIKAGKLPVPLPPAAAE